MIPTTLKELVKSAELPHDGEGVVGLLTNEDCTYISQEGEYWDFKETWPFSYSDEYFHGLARLTCAFANSDGGIVVFGVDDKTRKGGRTKTVPNVDKFELALKQLLGSVPKLKLRRYTSESCGDVDVLMVCRKEDESPPFRFLKASKSYPAGKFWVRKGSEVVEADAQDVPQLFLNGNFEESEFQQPAGYLPMTQSFSRDFVGRLDTLSTIFSLGSENTTSLERFFLEKAVRASRRSPMRHSKILSLVAVASRLPEKPSWNGLSS